MAEIKKIKPSLPKGTRDFLPEEVARRNYIFDTIKSVFRKFGFQQIDTPAFERLETLTGKYGEEGDRLLFKILNSGNPFKDLTEPELKFLYEHFDEQIINKPFIESLLEEAGGTKNEDGTYEVDPIKYDKVIQKYISSAAKKLAEKGLRYDLTVPLARYVVQHQSDLTFPFKRFHIAPVWRADRPQKGRYQEFYQCDADVIGSTSLLNEVELTQIYIEVFEKLKINVTIRINNRKLIDEIFSHLGIKENKSEVISIIDKIDKIVGNVGDIFADQLLNEGLSKDKIGLLYHLVVNRNYPDKFESSGALTEINFLFSHLINTGKVDFDPSLMRGLDYYTGTIWEVKPIGVQMGSLGGGGRYDNLTEMFGGRDMSGVGISFGIERIYDVMEELNLFPAELGETTKVLFVHFDDASEAYAFEQLQKVRAADIASEIYPGRKKLDKQMNYANDKKIPFVAVIGGDEMSSHQLTFKNMSTGEQEKLTIEEIIERLEK